MDFVKPRNEKRPLGKTMHIRLTTAAPLRTAGSRVLSLVLTKITDSATGQLMSDWVVGHALDGIVMSATMKTLNAF